MEFSICFSILNYRACCKQAVEILIRCMGVIVAFPGHIFMDNNIKKVREYDQEIPQSHNAEQPTVP